MTKYFSKLLIAFFLLTSIFILTSLLADKKPTPGEIVKVQVLKELSEFETHLNQGSKTENIEAQKKLYHLCRLNFKRTEYFLEFFTHRVVKYFINGAPVPKFDPENSKVSEPPAGLQLIETYLYDSKEDHKPELKKEWEKLEQRIHDIRKYLEGLEIENKELLEMSQLELFRITALNLCGYDATVTQTNVREALWSFEGLETVVNAFKNAIPKDKACQQHYFQLKKQLSDIKTYLLKNSSYASFNHLEFITQYSEPFNKHLVEIHNDLKLPWTEQSALNLNEGHLFRKKSFNEYYFAQDYSDTLHHELQADLGRFLFFDPVLSGNGNRACASCHNPLKAFTDGLPKSRSVDSTVFLGRNAPSLINVLYQRAFFYDGRALQLEQQAFDVIHNTKEMQSNLDDAVVKLRQSAEYKRLFAKAFASTQDSVITPSSVQKAITEYEKTLISFNSKFDQYLAGNKKALKAKEIKGFNLFEGKALCGSCHFFPLFNGTVPPYFNDSEYEVLGVPESADNKKLDEDKGRYDYVKLEEFKHAFKIQTVRNIELTAPYMHNGVYKNLNQVIDFYNHGGGAGFGFNIPNQTLPFDSLKLNNTEKKEIIAFLKTLTDTIGLNKIPSRLPKFENNETLNKRRIGGVY